MRLIRLKGSNVELGLDGFVKPPLHHSRCVGAVRGASGQWRLHRAPPRRSGYRRTAPAPAGSSRSALHGVSTIYLAALRDNLDAVGGEGVVIGTEHEPEKARAAWAHFLGAGLTRFIDLREGDLRETLRHIDGPVDFTLVDIWIPMARPALELIAPHLRRGAIVVCDNTEQHRIAYADYFAFINDPAQQFRTMTLPFAAGLEMSVRCE